MRIKTVMAACAGLGLSLSMLCIAEDPDEKQRVAAERMEFMMGSLRDLRVTPGNNPTVPWALHPKPLLRWSNPLGGARDGIVVIWTDGVRPTVFGGVFQGKSGDWFQEYESLAPVPFTLRDGNQVLWEPRKRTDDFRSIDDGPPPAKTAVKRLRQLRDLAEEFAAYSDLKGDRANARHELRLMPNPLYRYQAADEGVIDGAVFAFALGTDPELFLVIEARQMEGGQGWQCAFAAMTCWAVEVKRQGQPIWSIGERRKNRSPQSDFLTRQISPIESGVAN
jgi:hypothetical protein